MKKLYHIIFLTIFTSCSSQLNDKAVDKSFKSENLRTGISNIQRDTTTMNGQQLVQTSKAEHFYGLTSLSGDTIVKFEDYYFKVQFIDIDEDGFKDIRVFILSNTPNQCDNYLFKKDSKKYLLIENCNLDIQLLKGTKLFYSYNRTGCSDMDWESHLSKIENGTEINIGLMNVKGCGDKDDGITVYKINGNDKKLTGKLSIRKFENNGINNKWSFLKEYWTKNYKAFE